MQAAIALSHAVHVVLMLEGETTPSAPSMRFISIACDRCNKRAIPSAVRVKARTRIQTVLEEQKGNLLAKRKEPDMWKRFFVALLLLAAAFNAGAAANYTDVYYDTAEPGWGAFLVQSDTFQFIAFFIYGSDGKPTWYTAALTDDGTGKYTGSLTATVGTYFANPWQGYTPTPAGTVIFQPTDIYHANLTYTVTGVPTIVKSIQRTTLTPEKMGGGYSGSMAGSISGCSDPTANDPAFRARYGLAVSQDGDASATLVFTFVDTSHAGIVCTATGPLTHLGRLYQLGGTLSCTGPGTDGNPRPSTIDSLHPTGQGIEGKITANAGGGCTASLHFAAVNVNN